MEDDETKKEREDEPEWVKKLQTSIESLKETLKKTREPEESKVIQVPVPPTPEPDEEEEEDEPEAPQNQEPEKKKPSFLKWFL